jgi:enoyl-[acyl-carrier protein] reductase II
MIDVVAASLRTALCRLLGIDYPVFSAGIGAGARAELVGAVSNAGGFGVLGASGVPPDSIRAEIQRTRALTDRPFGINVIIAEDSAADVEEDREFFRAQFRAAAEEGATAVVLFRGDPAPLAEGAHASGLKVLIQCRGGARRDRAVGACPLRPSARAKGAVAGAFGKLRPDQEVRVTATVSVYVPPSPPV